MLISQRIPHFNGGVSQQDERLRDPSQGSEQLNCLTDPAHGLVSRPPAVHDAYLEGVAEYESGAYVHTITRDLDEKFRVVIRNGDLKVFRISDGVEFTVYAPNGKDYLAGDPNDFRALTLGNTTFIVNQGVPVATLATESETRRPEALVFVRRADYSTTFTVRVDNFEASYTTPASDAASAREAIETGYIARSLLEALQGISGFTSVFTCVRYGSAIYLTRADSKDFTVTTEDGLADIGLLAVKDQVQRLEDLPLRAKDGFLVEVVGDPGTEYDNHWLVYTEGNTPEEFGVWRETVAPGVPTSLDASTMPHELVLSGELAERGTAGISVIAPSTRAATSTTAEWSWTDYTDSSGSGVIAAGNLKSIGSHNAEVSGLAPAGTFGVLTTVTVDVQVDASTLVAGETVRLYLELDDGLGAYTTLATQEIVAGLNTQVLLNGTGTPVSGSRIRVKMQYGSGATPGSSFEEASVTTRLNNPGTYWNLPKARSFLTYGEATYVDFGNRDWPPYQIRLTVGGVNFDYTPSAPEGSATVATALAALIDAHASYVATSEDGLVRVFNAGGGSAPSVTPTLTWSNATHVRVENVNLTGLASVVGSTVSNLNDGSSATIVSASGEYIVCDGLTGGNDNEFAPGDRISIVRSGNYFVLRAGAWRGREVGDLVTNPWPTFVDKTITDMVFYQNRLGLLYGDELHMSASGDLLNFFRQTATVLRADDAFGVQAASRVVNAFDSAINWDQDLYLKSENGITRLTGDPLLSATTVRMDYVAGYESSPEVPLLALGKSLFLFRRLPYGVQVQEVYRTDEDNFGQLDLTRHCPSYIQGTPVQAFGDAALGFLGLITDDAGSSRLFIYRWFDSGRERVFSSWSEWTFDGELLGGDLVDGVVGLVFKHDTVVTVEEIDLHLDPSDALFKIRHLDRRAELTGSHSGGITTWTLPAAVATDGSEGTLRVFRKDTKAEITVLDRPSPTTIRATGNFSGVSVWIGVTYTQRFDFTPLYARVEGIPDTRGRLQLRRGTFEYHDSTDLTVSVAATGRGTETYSVNESAPTDGLLRVPLLARNREVIIQLSNSTPGGFCLSALEWEGMRETRSRRQ